MPRVSNDYYTIVGSSTRDPDPSGPIHLDQSIWATLSTVQMWMWAEAVMWGKPSRTTTRAKEKIMLDFLEYHYVFESSQQTHWPRRPGMEGEGGYHGEPVHGISVWCLLSHLRHRYNIRLAPPHVDHQRLYFTWNCEIIYKLQWITMRFLLLFLPCRGRY